MPPMVLFICIAGALLVDCALPLRELITPPHSYLGIVLMLAGISLALWTDSIFKKRGFPIKPHDTPAGIEREGPFCMSRHPMYLGMAFIILGIAVLLGSLTAFLFPVIFIVVMDRVFIPLEELNLEREFGADYRAYKKGVRRWV